LRKLLGRGGRGLERAGEPFFSKKVPPPSPRSSKPSRFSSHPSCIILAFMGRVRKRTVRGEIDEAQRSQTLGAIFAVDMLRAMAGEGEKQSVFGRLRSARL
jgi:hypothetical protein